VNSSIPLVRLHLLPKTHFAETAPPLSLALDVMVFSRPKVFQHQRFKMPLNNAWRHGYPLLANAESKISGNDLVDREIEIVVLVNTATKEDPQVITL
jgi:hypothetical protein